VKVNNKWAKKGISEALKAFCPNYFPAWEFMVGYKK